MGLPLRLSPRNLSLKYGIPQDEIEAAYANFDRTSALLIGFSGKIGAGKDTVAPLVFEELQLAPESTRTDAFGANLKIELNGLIRAILDSDGPRNAAREIARSYGVTREEAANTVGLIYNEVQDGVLSKGSDRTQGARAALQYWATEVRRNQDELYWVKPVLRRAIGTAARGQSTQITDCRFHSEVQGIMDAGGWTVRLDVGEAAQRRRILQRDGFEIKESTKRHSSETELDDFGFFTVRADTERFADQREVAFAVAHDLRLEGSRAAAARAAH